MSLNRSPRPLGYDRETEERKTLVHTCTHQRQTEKQTFGLTGSQTYTHVLALAQVNYVEQLNEKMRNVSSSLVILQKLSLVIEAQFMYLSILLLLPRDSGV